MTPNTQDVPLLSTIMVSEALPELVMLLDPEESNVELLGALQAIADDLAATYNTATHELVPLGTRVAVERVIAEMRNSAVTYNIAMFDWHADELQRTLEGGR